MSLQSFLSSFIGCCLLSLDSLDLCLLSRLFSLSSFSSLLFSLSLLLHHHFPPGEHLFFLSFLLSGHLGGLLCLGLSFGDGGESLTLLLLLLNFFLVDSLGFSTERLLLCLISLLLGLSSFRLDHTNLILSFSGIKFNIMIRSLIFILFSTSNNNIVTIR